MPSIVQMYDVVVICKGSSRVGSSLSFVTPSVEIGSSTGVEDGDNTRFSWRVTQMPTAGQTWIIFDAETEHEYNVDWPE